MLNVLRHRLVAGRRRTAAKPADDVAAFLDVARRSFVSVQQAWDRGDLSALSCFAAGPLLDELRLQLAERGPGPNHTEVLRIEARLLALEDVRQAQVASVEFWGLIREQPDQRPRPFREVWMLARTPEHGDAWRVVRVQALG